MNILFISEILPINTYASDVVFHRHFKRLISEGHTIHILTDVNSYANRKKDLDSVFRIHLLPNRKWYYPPYKPYGILQKIRFFDYYQLHAKAIIEDNQIDTLIGFVYGDFLATFCSFVQIKTGLPLYSFFHDDTSELNSHKSKKISIENSKKILEVSRFVFIASEALIDNWPQFSKKLKLLYPIPEDARENDKLPIPTKNKAIAYSGSVYNEVIPYLEKVSLFLYHIRVPFYIIGNNDNAKYLSYSYKNVHYQTLFETAKESNDFLIATCKACIIPYPQLLIEMPWIKTCFPSKFIQYTRMGIPTIIIAPIESALGKWCIKNKWPLYLKEYNQKELYELLATKITTTETLNMIELFSSTMFNPDYIHKQLVNYLTL
ncbi:hypothetical protein GCM10022246_07790 [Pedobacter ginsengiterrae]|uniref:Uncharacterized protein n=1 Tax=Pedobacter ginsengiterrae TaxID=871696 RepID=A0ABP7NYR8_9SPHI